MLSYIVGGLGAAALLAVLPCSMRAQEKAAMTTPELLAELPALQSIRRRG
jgi:hypothetical protein